MNFKCKKLGVEIFLKFSSCLGFDNHVGQTNKLKIVHTLWFELYTVHYVPYRHELSSTEISQESGHMWEMPL